jgi:hypothetical protein
VNYLNVKVFSGKNRIWTGYAAYMQTNDISRPEKFLIKEDTRTQRGFSFHKYSERNKAAKEWP